jgi:hypothetical protein
LNHISFVMASMLACNVVVASMLACNVVDRGVSSG